MVRGVSSEPQAISRHDILQLLKLEKTADSAFVLVDLRRTGYEARIAGRRWMSPLTLLTVLLGRHDTGVDQLASPEPLSDHAITLQDLQRCCSSPSNLVLR